MEAVLKDLSNFSSTTSNLGLQNPGFAAFLIVIAITLVAVIVFNGLIYSYCVAPVNISSCQN